MTALPVRSLPFESFDFASGAALAFDVHRRLALVVTGASEAGLFLIEDRAGPAEESPRVISEGLSAELEGATGRLVRRVMMGGEIVAITAADPSEEDEEQSASAFLGVPIGGSGSSVRGCLCVTTASVDEWSEQQVGALSDIAALVERDLALRSGRQERRALETVVRMLAKAVDNMQLGVTITDLDGRIVYTNPAEARMHGYRVEELLGQSARIFGPPEQSRSLDVRDPGDAVSWTRETVNVRKDGSRFEVLLWSDAVTDEAGRPIGLVTCCEDITERKRTENTLRDVALRDPLTGLGNRSHFHERLRTAIELQRADARRRFAVLFLDLDRFKIVNDSLGHHVGDELLRVIAERLQRSVRPQDTVARFGGDEFAVLLEELGAGDTALQIAGRILTALSSPVELEGYDLVTSASIGVVQGAAHMTQPEYVWQAADMAMYRAKAAGPGRYEVFDRTMHLEAVARLQMETELRHALDVGEFRLAYQPVVDLASGRLLGFEALLRWEHPERGTLGPTDFVPIAEETGLILRLGDWVLQQACQDASRWPMHRDGSRLWVAANLAAKQLSQPGIEERVRAAIEAAGIAPQRLYLELTESSVMQGADTANRALWALKSLGVRLLLDDFGTGYSSLAYLHRLPIDGVKVDRSCVDVLRDGARQSLLLEGVVRVAKDAGLRVIAEGVSEREQVATLVRLGCDAGQGFLFAPPLGCDEIPRFLRRCGAV